MQRLNAKRSNRKRRECHFESAKNETVKNRQQRTGLTEPIPVEPTLITEFTYCSIKMIYRTFLLLLSYLAVVAAIDDLCSGCATDWCKERRPICDLFDCPCDVGGGGRGLRGSAGESASEVIDGVDGHRPHQI